MADLPFRGLTFGDHPSALGFSGLLMAATDRQKRVTNRVRAWLEIAYRESLTPSARLIDRAPGSVRFSFQH